MFDTVQFQTPNYYAKILAAFDTNGKLMWYKHFGSSLSAPGYKKELTIDNIGNIYVADESDAPYILFNNGADTIYNSGIIEAYLAKFDSSGNYLWCQQAHATGMVRSNSCHTAGDGNVYWAGTLSDSASFGSYTVEADAIEDMFVSRYNTNGDCLGIVHTGEARSYEVIANADGSCLVVGEFTNSIAFGSYSLSNFGNSDIFIAKHSEIVGVEEEERRPIGQLNIYANPSQGKCNITIPDEFLHEKNLVLTIFDNTGRIIQQKQLTMDNEKIKLDLEAEAKGIYHVTLGNGKKSYTGKIVFE